MILSCAGISTADELLVLEPPAKGEKRREMLRDYLRRHVHQALDRRLAEFEELQTPEQIEAYQKRLRAKFAESLGGFPKKTALRARTVGQLKGDGYRAEKVILQPEDGIVLPAVYFEPDGGFDYPVLYVNSAGKGAVRAADGSLTGGGFDRGFAAALVVDLRGYGETEMKSWRYGATADYVGNNAAEYFVAYMLGRSLVGMRTEDLLVSARYLASRTGKGKVRLIAMGDVIEPAGHAVALEPELFASFRMEGTGGRPRKAVPYTTDFLENAVHGALRVYDRDDLTRLGIELNAKQRYKDCVEKHTTVECNCSPGS